MDVGIELNKKPRLVRGFLLGITMRFSQYFQLNLEQPYLDFLDIPLDTDVAAFVDPTALKQLDSDFGHAAQSLMQTFFDKVLQHITSNNLAKAIELLSKLSESNEFHLGLSKGKARGHGIGAQNATKLGLAISQSKASKSGLLQDLEDTCLVIEGIGSDMISDAICNIIRGPLIEYTQEMCNLHNIPLTPNINSGAVWNGDAWVQHYTKLPMTNEGKIILVPKMIVRYNISYSSTEYYRHYLLEDMRLDEIQRATTLVHYLKNGAPRVTKTDLLKKYGKDKTSIETQTLKHPAALENYKKDKLETLSNPLDHEDISEITNTQRIDWANLKLELSQISTGRPSAHDYERLIEKTLTALFYPCLSYPKREKKIHAGRKRVDIEYTNCSKNGFFSWLAQHYTAPKIFIECKNYDDDLNNPEIDQLAGRFSPSRGQFGIISYRKCKDPEKLKLRCQDTAKDHRGYIITLSDAELIELIDSRASAKPYEFPLLYKKFNELID
jgi:hypothetical protein